MKTGEFITHCKAHGYDHLLKERSAALKAVSDLYVSLIPLMGNGTLRLQDIEIKITYDYLTGKFLAVAHSNPQMNLCGRGVTRVVE
jgi:hypothetical protein